MKWINEPAKWSSNKNDLTVSSESSTDFWRVTGEGIGAIRDNGHLFGENVDSDFDLSMDIHGHFAAQYDHAGAMVRVDDHHWIKTGVEYFDGRPRFSTVVTSDYSNWMLAPLPENFTHLAILISRRGNAVQVRRSRDDGQMEFSAQLYAPPDRTVFAGAMCAAPKSDGFDVTFRNLTLAPK
jgi:hypothetical protein